MAEPPCRTTDNPVCPSLTMMPQATPGPGPGGRRDAARFALVCLLRLTRDEFVDYYERRHVPLILSLAPAPAYYARNYLPAAQDRRWSADFDVITHMKFADCDSYDRWIGTVMAEGSPVP
jgi:EthD domain